MKRRSLGQLWMLLIEYRASILCGAFLTLLPAYFAVWIPLLIGRLVDEALLTKDTAVAHQFLWLIAYVFVCQFVFSIAVNYLLIRLGLKVLVDYRLSLVRRILRFELRFLDKISAGKLATRLTSDVNALYEFFSTAVAGLLGSFFVIVAVFGVLFWMDWRLASGVALSLLVLSFITVYFNERIRRRFGFSRKSMTQLNTFTGESLMGLRDLQGMGVRESTMREFESWSQRQAALHLKAVQEYAYYQPLIAFVLSIQTAVLLGFGGLMVMHQEISLGQLVSFLAFANFFAGPLQEFAEKISVFQQAMAAVDRLTEISSGKIEKSEGESLEAHWNSIELRDLSFKYPDAHQSVFESLNLRLRAGEKIGVVGETGAGKSTLSFLLLRFYEPTAGSILIDGRDLRSISMQDWRRQCAWVSQDVQLFTCSLRENLRLFESRITDSEMIRALEVVQLGDWFRALPQGLDTLLREKALELSSGQRQLLSVARALCLKPRLLIFDEATAYIDSSTEWQFITALERLWEERDFKEATSLVIAHRWSTLKRCDRILWISRSKPIKECTFEDLRSHRMDLNFYENTALPNQPQSR
jgi:ATP-binding cassette subfamily B multidrug efflux pump